MRRGRRRVAGHVAGPGQVQARPARPRAARSRTPELWLQVSTDVRALREQLRLIPKDDRVRGRCVQGDQRRVRGLVRADRTDAGPLADAARVLARGAQIASTRCDPSPPAWCPRPVPRCSLPRPPRAGREPSLRPCCSVSSSSPPGHSSRRTRRCVTPARRPRSRTLSARSSTPSVHAFRRSRRPRRPRTLLQQHPRPRPRCRWTHAQRKHAASSTCSAAHRVPGRRTRSRTGSIRRSLQHRRPPGARRTREIGDR